MLWIHPFFVPQAEANLNWDGFFSKSSMQKKTIHILVKIGQLRHWHIFFWVFRVFSIWPEKSKPPNPLVKLTNIIQSHRSHLWRRNRFRNGASPARNQCHLHAEGVSTSLFGCFKQTVWKGRLGQKNSSNLWIYGVLYFFLKSMHWKRLAFQFQSLVFFSGWLIERKPCFVKNA